ncbi:MAG: hypothetical protein LQ338_000107 [Usnochroma carphineum]|nr:MAG: hypothetical protein LQ338_000107 [Usnochroma carphineum]
MDFVTIGMFIIDEIHYQPPTKSDFNVMGGAGLYAALGARLFRPPPLSFKVGWVIHQGYDFPPQIKATIDSWETSCRFIQTPDRPTTRAWNKYEPSGYRSFKYLNEKTRIDENCLTKEQLMSKSYHLICSADRCISVIQGIARKRRDLASADQSDERTTTAVIENPVFLWEPLPDLCKPSELEGFLKALKHVDVVSPNLEEFCNLLGIRIDLDKPSGWDLLRHKCAELIGPSIGNSEVALVVRLGEKGCFVAQPNRYVRLPAYHQQAAASRVVDPTGGGNSFLGGLAVGVLQSTGSSRAERLEEAAVYGAVAASFAIEQVGVPTLQRLESQKELWNGDEVERRLEKYRERLIRQANQEEGRSNS